MKILSAFFLVIFLISCGASVSVDYDKEINFSKYSTFDFYPNITSSLSDLDDKRIVRISDSLLQLRGFVRSEKPDFYVNFFAHESVSESRNTIGVGLGTGGRNLGVGVSGGIPIGGKSVNQRLTLDFIDVVKDDLIWQAVADGDFKEKSSPAEKEKYYTGILNKMLSKYPIQRNQQ